MKRTGANTNEAKLASHTMTAFLAAFVLAVSIACLTGVSIGYAHASDTMVATQATTYDIVYRLGGGTQAEGQVTSIAKGKTVKASKLKAPKRSRYKFSGWYANRALTQKATVLRGVADPAKRTVYAKWTLKSYNIIYSLNGGLLPSKHTKTIGKNKTVKASSLVKPTRRGYTFVGWYSDKNLKAKAKTLRGVADSAKRTVYAKWKPVTYVISYELNGGTFTSSYPTEFKPSAGLAHLPEPTREGFSFIGWYSDAALTRHVTSIPANASGNQALYAKWAERVKIAHRGSCEGGAAANSLDAFNAAADKGFAYVDVDIRFTSSGKAVLATADGHVPPEPTYLEGGQVVNPYTEALAFLELCKERKLVPYIELTAGTQSQVQALVKTVDDLRMTDSVRWMSPYRTLLEYVQAIHPQAHLVVLANEVTDDTVRSANAIAARGGDVSIGVSAAHADAQAVTKCRDAGIPLGVWALSNAAEIAGYDRYVNAFAIAG